MDLEYELSRDELKVFLDEAEEQIQLLSEGMIRLERGADGAVLEEIFRAAHTLKGSSGMIGFRAMAELTHVLEDVLDRLRKGLIAASPALVDILLRSVDSLNALKDDLADGRDASTDVTTLVHDLRVAADGEPQTAGSPVLYRVEVSLKEALGWAAVRAYQVLARLEELGEVLASEPTPAQIEAEKVGETLWAELATEASEEDMVEAIGQVDDVAVLSITRTGGEEDRSARRAAPEAAGAVAGPLSNPVAEALAEKTDAPQTMRIDVEKLDQLMNMVGELVIDRTRLGQIARNLQARDRDDELVQQLADTSAHIVKVVDALNESVMLARMLPIDMLFRKFPRMARDLARGMGKNVEFVVEGGDTEIDRSVIEKIKDPLVHLIRNALDHGVESPAERQAAGKRLPATVRLSARHVQGSIEITLSDDGRGIDTRRVREAAVNRGDIALEAAERLTEQETLNLIFRPGVSTAEQTTEISGRGVGMDVVRRSITALGGLIRIDTTEGAGTTFTIRLPLTLATFRGLLVRAGSAAYAIPLSYVQETVKLTPGSVQSVLGREVLNLRGAVMPLARLGSIWSLGDRPAGASPDEGFLVVLRSEDHQVALALDDLLDQQEIVVKPLGDYAGQAAGIAGASILGDGQVALIIDVPSLFRLPLLQGALVGAAEGKGA